jgi:hypothetical protein
VQKGSRIAGVRVCRQLPPGLKIRLFARFSSKKPKKQGKTRKNLWKPAFSH